MMARASRTTLAESRPATILTGNLAANPEIALFQFGHEFPPHGGSIKTTVKASRPARTAMLVQRNRRHQRELAQVARLEPADQEVVCVRA